jgi:ribosomal-protein-alanine N-acetyltransferase
MKIPGFQTHRLRLRAFRPQDEDALFNLLQTPGILQYFPSPQAPKRESVRRFIQNQIDSWAHNGYGWWAVEPRNSKLLLGWCGLQYLPETDETEIGFLLSRDVWGRGYATETARISLRFGFTNFDFPEIIGLAHPQNRASIRVLEKLGMDFNGLKFYFGMDLNKYSISRSSWQQRERKQGS